MNSPTGRNNEASLDQEAGARNDRPLPNPDLPDQLRRRLESSLPGPEIVSLYEPTISVGSHYADSPVDAQPAAVLVLLYPHEGRWHVPLTLRGSHLDHHAGQVSLPGGMIEPGETASEAAVREFHEELGAEDVDVRILGPLTPLYLGVSHFRVEPWLAVADHRGCMRPDNNEVDELFEVPLAHLLDPRNFGRHERRRGEARFLAPHFLWHNHYIWGATCMILGELVTIVRELDASSSPS
jgi:8-oxo-dGTP pyrophosphatase MutT (NUDIX family)